MSQPRFLSATVIVISVLESLRFDRGVVHIVLVSYTVTPSAMKRGVASLEGDNWKVFYYLSTSEIWPDMMVGFDGSGLIREELLYYQPLLINYLFMSSYIIFYLFI